MARISERDIPDRLAAFAPAWIVSIGAGCACAITALAIRALLDTIVYSGAPFAFVYPATILATLFARWLAGTTTALLMTVYVWYFLYPVRGSFAFAQPGGPMTIVAILVVAALTIGIADAFRRAARQATAERDRQIADRDLFLAEFDHRVKNNFAIVAGLLEMQKRRADPATQQALTSALMRIESIARAHRHLYRGSGGPGEVDMEVYLGELCTALADTLTLGENIRLTCTAQPARIERDRAVSIGLVVNELVTNAAKHAFVDRERGAIAVSFAPDAEGEGWRVCVADNGVGMLRRSRPADGDGGLGSRLIDAFARQASGALETETGPNGTCVTMRLDR